MKNGFTWQGFEGQVEGGSFLRAQEQLQYGKQIGNYSVYIAASQINDGGWRIAGAQQLTSFYGDVGYKANGFESHLQLTAGNNQFGVASLTRSSCCRTIGQASSPFLRRPMTRWP
jgi:iron complex outermembrane recepter protein